MGVDVGWWSVAADQANISGRVGTAEHHGEAVGSSGSVKYLSKLPIFFGPPKRQPASDRISQQALCEHDHGTAFNGYVWRCRDCGKKMTEQ